MTKKEAVEAMYDVRNALVMVNKFHTCDDFKDALVLATRLILYLKKNPRECISTKEKGT